LFSYIQVQDFFNSSRFHSSCHGIKSGTIIGVSVATHSQKVAHHAFQTNTSIFLYSSFKFINSKNSKFGIDL
jgi:hypothetical protein